MKDSIFNDLYLGEEYAYLRPYICRGNPYGARVFLTGINPATPIYPRQVSLDRYIEIVKNYETFMDFYLKIRKKQNKSELSRTRMGINSLVDWIENECNTRVVETDIFTYPTKNVKELLTKDNPILNKSIEKFWQVLLEFKPDTIILYGSLTVDVLKKLLKDKNKQVEYFCENGIEDIEKTFPFARFNIDSRSINVLAYRHLMYYGKSGKSFENLRQNIKKSLGKDKEIER